MIFLKIEKSKIDFLNNSRVPKVCTTIEQTNNESVADVVIKMLEMYSDKKVHQKTELTVSSKVTNPSPPPLKFDR